MAKAPVPILLVPILLPKPRGSNLWILLTVTYSGTTFSSIYFSESLRNRLISAGLELVLSHAEFSSNIKIKIIKLILVDSPGHLVLII